MNKQRLLLLSLISLLSLAGCQISDPTTDVSRWDKVQRDVYSANRFAETESIESSKLGTMEFYRSPKSAYALYTNLDDYAKLISLNFVDGITYTVSNDIWQVKKGGDLMFQAGIDRAAKAMYYAGSLSSAFPGQKTIADYGTLMYRAKFDSNALVNKPVSIHSYANFDSAFPLVAHGGKLYAPINVFDAAIGTGLNHFDNQSALLQYSSYDQLAYPMGKDNAPFNDGIASLLDASGNLPEGFARLERASFYYQMDCNYGLGYGRGYLSMSEYFHGLGFDDRLLETNPSISLLNYVDAINSLNDCHSGIGGLVAGLGDKKVPLTKSPIYNEKINLRAGLSAVRAKTYAEKGKTPRQDVLYSASGKTAYFSFDQFFMEAAPFVNGTQTLKDDVWKSDDFYFFVKCFEEIKAKGGVEKVIIDDSCNGGGVVAVAVKLLALISKDNDGYIYMQDLNSGSLTKESVRVDTNGDGQYDTKDVYGDDFEISILTSLMSFSCGNLFPCVSQKYLGTKILGVKSGGGECAVGSFGLPSGRGFKISSKTRLVYSDSQGKNVEGVENGAIPDVPFDYSLFYDVDALETAINEAE